MSNQVPIHEGLFTWPSAKPQLLGSRCVNCAETAFPAQPDCRNCGSRETTVVELGDQGILWSWTIQGFLPKSPPYAGKETPKTFKPYGVGYIQLADEVIVESRLTTAEASELKIGMDMELVIIPFTTDDDGNDIVTFAFAPVKK